MADHSHTLPDSDKNDPLQSCIAQMLNEVPAEARGKIPRGNVEALGKSLWEWFLSTDEASLRLRHTKDVDPHWFGQYLLEVVGPDRPFLVDSLLGACADLGLEVLTLFHPIVEHNGQAQSLIQIHMTNLNETEQKQLLEEAGWTDSDGNGIRDKEVDGSRIDFKFNLMLYGSSKE